MQRSTRYAVGLIAVLALLSWGLVTRGTISQVPTGTWAPAGSKLTVARSGAASIALQDGRVLIAGGDSGAGAVASAEIFDTSGAFSATASMTYLRSKHTATLLGDGRVLVAGGMSGATAAATAEIFDPVANTWTPTSGTLAVARSGHTASLLADGTVLIAGGDSSGTALSSLEIFNPVTGTFSTAPGALTSAREAHAAAVLQSGQAIIIGGFDGVKALASSDLYDPTTGLVSAGPVLSTPRQGLSATTQLDGKVFVAGGNNGSQNGNQDLASAEVYDPSAGTFALTGSLATASPGTSGPLTAS